MNGRVYDYNLGRFMSVDPFIQAPTNTQSVNPYSYIMNNPMAGTDPTGYVSTKDEIEEINHGETAKKDNEEKVETNNGQKNERRTARRDYRSASKVGSPSRVNRAINQVVSWAKAVKKETANLRESGAVGDIAVDFSGIESAADSVIEAANGNYGKAVLAAGGLLLGKVKAVSNVLDNAGDAVIEVTKSLRRPYLRKSTRQSIQDAAPKTADGKFIDPNTGKVIDGKFHYGHKYGHKHRRLKEEAEAKGMTQKEFNDYINNNPNYFQIEDPVSNMSHKFEKKGK